MKDIKKYTISSDIRRVLGGLGFIIGVAGMALVITLSSLESIIEAARSTTPALVIHMNSLFIYNYL